MSDNISYQAKQENQLQEPEDEDNYLSDSASDREVDEAVN